MDKFTQWFYQGLGIVTFWIAGQILVEAIKVKMQKSSDNEQGRPWSGKERRQQKLMIDQALLEKFFGIYKDQVETLQAMGMDNKIYHDLVLSFTSQLSDYRKLDDDLKLLLEQIHSMVVKGQKYEDIRSKSVKDETYE